MKILTVLYNRVLFDSVSGCGNALIADTNKMGASSTNIFTSEEKEKKTKKKGSTLITWFLYLGQDLLFLESKVPSYSTTLGTSIETCGLNMILTIYKYAP